MTLFTEQTSKLCTRFLPSLSHQDADGGALLQAAVKKAGNLVGWIWPVRSTASASWVGFGQFQAQYVVIQGFVCPEKAAVSCEVPKGLHGPLSYRDTSDKRLRAVSVSHTHARNPKPLSP